MPSNGIVELSRSDPSTYLNHGRGLSIALTSVPATAARITPPPSRARASAGTPAICSSDGHDGARRNSRCTEASRSIGDSRALQVEPDAYLREMAGVADSVW